MNSSDIKKAPIFSIITICLNAGENLIETINSIIFQSFTDFEIIIKDGLSTDSSLENLPNDSRIKLFVQNDRGIYDAMNQSLQYISGKYLVFINAGDSFYNNDVLLHFYNTIIMHKEIGLFYCDYITSNLKKKVLSPSTINNFTLFRNMLCHQCCFFEVEKFRKTGYFNLEYKVVADYDFLLRFIIKNKYSHFHINFLGIKYLSEGFSFNSKELMAKEVSIVRKRYFGTSYNFYLFLLNLTLPSLRKKIYYSNNTFLKKILLTISNRVNKN